MANCEEAAEEAICDKSDEFASAFGANCVPCTTSVTAVAAIAGEAVCFAILRRFFFLGLSSHESKILSFH